MSNYLKYLITNHPVRRKQKDKDLFIEYIKKETSKYNYNCKCDDKSEHKNIIIGNIDESEVIFTAHYDTPPKAIVPNIMMPRNPKIAKLYSFGIFIILALISLGLGYLISNLLHLEKEIFVLLYLVLYFGSTFLMFRTFDNKNNYNDNTSGVASILELIKASDNYNNIYHNNKVAYILFDNEEKGLKGSKYLAKENPNLNSKLIINLDCVGNGDTFIFICKDKAKDLEVLNKLKEYVTKINSNYKFEFYSTEGSFSNSDYKSFEKSVGVMACIRRENKIIKYYTPRIHTNKDIIVCNDNITELVDTLKRGLIDEL